MSSTYDEERWVTIHHSFVQPGASPNLYRASMLGTVVAVVLIRVDPTGPWDVKGVEVDHVDGDRKNNRLIDKGGECRERRLFKSGREIPGELVVYHKDGKPANNAIDILAIFTRSENRRLARKINSNNSSGYNGVMWDKDVLSHVYSQ
ncbi:hypothetical protein BDZ88DRAFT_442510 [Geranomyces variabilis]|nr:hypothetical protein BDZ88DRAFT_442510 [Geranomyces variabilis]